MNPEAPKRYGLIKTHKPNAPIRPVVSYIHSTCRRLAIKLNRIIKELTNFHDPFSINNSVDLVNKLKNVTLPNNCKLVSFDVTNMFSNIPPSECLTILENLLHEKQVNIVNINEILFLFKLVVSQNYFKFNSKFYEQTNGLAMGSPLSPLLADLFMSNIVKLIMDSELSKKHILFWYRYVDDIFACFKGTDRQIDIFNKFLNNIHPNIVFTNEIEIESSINFLDLKITKKKINSALISFGNPPPRTLLVPLTHFIVSNINFQYLTR